jgi:membrane dipeptidase
VKKAPIVIGALLLVAMIGFFSFAPAIVERGMNRVEQVPLAPIRDEARELHTRLAIADLHADTLLWNRNLVERAGHGHADLPRLEEGNVALQIFSPVTKTPKGQNYDSNGSDSDSITLLTIAQLQPPRTWTSLLERSLWHARKLERSQARAQGRLRIVRSGADVRRLLADGAATGALLSIEGLHNLEGRLENVARLHAAGFRMAGLVHFFDNEIGGSMHGEAKGGLTPFGRQVVHEMEARGMIVDLAHASPALFADVIKTARRPVVSSHGGVQATCNVNRNLTDDQLRTIAGTGGLIGIGYWDGAVCDISPAAIAAAIDHARRIAGIDHVALGSDFDGAVTTAFDTAGLVHVTQALLDRGFSEGEVAKVMGGNLLRFLAEQLP